jgi:hypothetical protein
MLIIQSVNIAHLTAGMQFKFWEVGLENNGVEEFGCHD